MLISIMVDALLYNVVTNSSLCRKIILKRGGKTLHREIKENEKQILCCVDEGNG